MTAPDVTYWTDILRACIQARAANASHLLVKVSPDVRGVGSTRNVDGPGTPTGRVTAPGQMRLHVEDVARWAVMHLLRLGQDVYTDDAGALVVEPRREP